MPGCTGNVHSLQISVGEHYYSDPARTKNIEGKVKINFINKYETGGEVVEFEYLEAWNRKTLVAMRNLGKGKEEDRVVNQQVLCVRHQHQ